MATTLAVDNSQPMPRPSDRSQLFTQQFNRTFVAKCAHRLAVAPVQMLFQLTVQIIYTGKLLPIIEIPLAISVAPFYLTVVPRSPGWNENMFDLCFLQSNVKRTHLCFADILVGELRPVVRLDSLDREWKRLLQHPEKLHRILRCMLLKAIHKTHSGTFINGCPLVQMLAVFPDFAP